MRNFPQVEVVEYDTHGLPHHTEGAPEKHVPEKSVINDAVNATREVHQRSLCHHTLAKLRNPSRIMEILLLYPTEKSVVAQVAKWNGKTDLVHDRRECEDGKSGHRFRHPNSKKRVV